jgi:hypothetical protein
MEFHARKPGEENYQKLNQPPEERPDRHCTDIFCCLLFTAFVVVYTGVGVIGFKNGDPNLLLYPFDSSGNQCGLPDSATVDYPYLYYPVPVKDLSYAVCVQHCPKNASDVFCKSNNWVQDCSFTIRESDNSTSHADVYSSTGVLKRFCLPSADTVGNMTTLINSQIKTNFASAGSDILTCWVVVIYVMLIAIGLSIIYMIVLRYCVGLVIWVSVILIFFGLIGFGYYLKYNADLNHSDPTDAETYQHQIWCSYGCYAGAAIFALIIIFMCQRIALAIAIMKSAAGFIGDEFSVLLVPIISFVSTLGIIVFWGAALAFLYSSGEVVKTDKYKTFAAVTWDTQTRDLFYFEFVSILWINAFKVALVQFTIACTVYFWYFEQGTENHTHFKIGHALWAGVRYHLGSLAFGSLVLAIVQFIQIVLSYVQKHLFIDKYAGNAAVQYLCGCISCLMECFKRFIEFLNKNAYINIAYTSQNFCAAAWDSFNLLLNNALRFVALGSIGAVFTFLGKGLITILSSYLGYLIITQTEKYNDYIDSPLPVLLVFGIVSYVVAGLFTSVYEMACDSIIIFFLHDEQSNKTAVHAPVPLQEFMTENRSAPQQVSKA